MMKNKITFSHSTPEYPTFGTLGCGTIFQRADEPQVVPPTYMVLAFTDGPPIGLFAVRLDDGVVIRFGASERVIVIKSIVSLVNAGDN